MFAVRNIKQFLPVSRKGVNVLSVGQKHSVVDNYPEAEVSKLSNKIQIGSENWSSQTTSVGIYLNVGSRFDGEDKSGLNNMVTRMAIKGNARRSGAEIDKQCLEKGAYLDSFTDREAVGFNIHCLNKDVPWAVELLSEFVKNNNFDSGVLEKEKAVVLKEIDLAENDLRQVVFDYLHGAAYQGTPLANAVIGRPESVKQLSVNDLNKFVDNQFKGPRMVLTAAGGISHNELQLLAEKHLSDVPIHYTAGVIPEREKIRYTGSELRHRDDAYPLAHIALAIEGPPAVHQDILSFQVAAAINGNWNRQSGGGSFVASRFAAGGHKEGMTHSFDWFLIPYHDTSLWGVYFTGERMELTRISEAYHAEFIRMCTDISDFEVQRARNQLKTAMLLEAQNKGLPHISKTIGRDILVYGRRLSLSEIFSRLDRITGSTITKLGMENIYDRCLTMASFGPVEGLMEYGRTRTSMRRVRL